jgi:hypothetical protein
MIARYTAPFNIIEPLDLKSEKQNESEIRNAIQVSKNIKQTDNHTICVDELR